MDSATAYSKKLSVLKKYSLAFLQGLQEVGEIQLHNGNTDNQIQKNVLKL